MLYPNSAAHENELELNEGIAEYTGLIFAGRNPKETIVHFETSLDPFLKNSSYVRSFAYHTTPMYGYLLSKTDMYWNKQITVKTNLADFFIKQFKITIPKNIKGNARTLSQDYNGHNIIKEETTRNEKRQKLITEYKNKFLVQPHLTIALEKMNVGFNPQTLIPLEDKGTVYPNMRITDNWGVLTVEDGGALMSANWDKVTISNPLNIDGNNITGQGWKLQLNDGYGFEKDENNNYKLKKKK